VWNCDVGEADAVVDTVRVLLCRSKRATWSICLSSYGKTSRHRQLR